MTVAISNLISNMRIFRLSLATDLVLKHNGGLSGSNCDLTSFYKPMKLAF